MNFKSIAIIGAGPAGCMCAYFASENNEVTLFEFAKPLHTLLYTGGGRCNLAHAEYEFKELAKYYPRGEKFLYSIFSRFCTADTIDFFKKIGVETYTQDDMRVFPSSNSAQKVREAMLNSISKCHIKKEKVIKIEKDGLFTVTTDKNKYKFDRIVIAVGGHAGFSIAQSLGHKIIDPRPALTGLITKENFKQIQGVSLKNIKAEISCQPNKKNNVMLNSFQHRISERQSDPEKSSGRRIVIQDDMIFTHEGISGPLAYKISSICAREDFNRENSLKILLDFSSSTPHPNPIPQGARENHPPTSHLSPLTFQNMLNSNPKKDIKNLVAELVPKSIAEYVIARLETDSQKSNEGTKQSFTATTKCCDINGKTRDLIIKMLTEFEVNVISPAKEGEVVTSGGVCLDEINPKTMESKLVDGLYFCGEVIDVDGFCGGFNLQNCWSTGYVAGSSV